MSGCNLFVFRKLVAGVPHFLCDPLLSEDRITTNFKLAESRPSDAGWPAGPEWDGWEVVGLMTVSRQGGDRQYNKRARKEREAKLALRGKTP